MNGSGRLLLVPAFAALAAGLWLSLVQTPAAVNPPPTRTATAIDPPRPIAPFTLVRPDGTPFTAADLHGRWTLLTFGYASCPDVCPTTLALLSGVSRALPAPAPRVTFVSVDPERDTTARLGDFVTAFNPGFLGVTGGPAAIAGLAGQLGIPYARVELPGSALGYVMDHSAAVLLIDPDGRLNALFTPPLEPAAMVEDIQRLERHYRSLVKNH